MSLSSYTFTKALRPVTKFLRAKDIRLLAYMDNILLMASSFQRVLRTRIQAHISTIRPKRFIFLEKSYFIPSQVRDHLRFTLDTRTT